MTSSFFFRQICDRLQQGILVLDAGHRIVFWNAWLAQKALISEDEARGRTLAELFPEFNNPRFDWALDQAIKSNIPQIMSQTLNHYLIPIPIPDSGRHGLPVMQQMVHINQLRGEADDVYALVFIQDVTENVIRSSSLTEMVQRMRDESTRDSLTGLFNRRFMWEWLLPQLKLSVRNKQPLACLLLDVDLFKKINDTHGHDHGDQVLKQCAEIISTELRGSDIVVRYGGEEFVALLPHCDLAHGIEVAERILQTIRSTSITGLTPGVITSSIGVSVCNPANPVTGEDLLKQADKHLYNAKGAGRNQVKPDVRAVMSRLHAD